MSWGVTPIQEGPVAFRVTAIDRATGERSSPTDSNVLTLAPVVLTSGPAVPASTGGAGGTVTVSVSSGITVGPGATASLASLPAGSAVLRWVSLDESIATVDASGTVTGRSGGRAQILALSRGSDGSARVTLIIVTVSQ